MYQYIDVSIHRCSCTDAQDPSAEAAAPRGAGRRRYRMKVVDIGAMKGGAGKTMVSINVAACLSEDSKVLFIDADPQSNATKGLGQDVAGDGKTIADVFETPEIQPSAVIVESPLEKLPNLDLIPSTIMLFMTEMHLASRGGREFILHHWLSDNEAELAKYDYVFIDTNPGMGLVNQNAFYAADSIILVTDVSDNGLLGLEAFTFLWEEVRRDLRKENNVKALVVNNVDKRIGLSKELVEYCETDAELGSLLVKPVLPYRVAFKDTEVDSTPINVLHPGSEEHKLTVELVEALKKKGAL